MRLQFEVKENSKFPVKKRGEGIEQMLEVLNKKYTGWVFMDRPSKPDESDIYFVYNYIYNVRERSIQFLTDRIARNYNNEDLTISLEDITVREYKFDIEPVSVHKKGKSYHSFQPGFILYKLRVKKNVNELNKPIGNLRDRIKKKFENMKRHTLSFENFVNEGKNDFINESVGSDRFMEILDAINFPIINDTDLDFDVLDDRLVSFNNNNGGNQQISIGKALKRLNPNLRDYELNKYVNLFKVEFYSRDYKGNVEVVSGEELLQWYDRDSYAVPNGRFKRMTCDVSRKEWAFMANHPEMFSVCILLDENGKQRGHVILTHENNKTTHYRVLGETEGDIRILTDYVNNQRWTYGGTFDINKTIRNATRLG